MVDLCIHAANLFYLASYLVRDMLWLRVLTCVGLALGIVYFGCQATPMYCPLAWQVLFLGINGVQIRHLVRERRRLRLTEEQRRLGEATFDHLSREELLTLLTRAVSERPEALAGFPRTCDRQLSHDERVLRDLAFSRLTRQELLNLLTRRLWNSIKRRNPGRWGWPRRGGAAAPDGQGLEIPGRSAAG